MRGAVVVFPGSNCDHDALHVLGSVLGEDVKPVWHAEERLPAGTDAVILPGGFSYGDYLRCGAIARFAPIMKDVRRHAEEGGFLLGICNGFQVLCEAGLLPGALLRNADLRFHCHDVRIRVESTSNPLTASVPAGTVLRIPISHGDGNFFAPPDQLDELERNGQVVFRYCDPAGAVVPEANPNGSARSIAGISSRSGNVVGLMPHPERLSEEILGGTDGLPLFRSMVAALAAGKGTGR
jgi:phosphoribosylformylglycinamidine synthase